MIYGENKNIVLKTFNTTNVVQIGSSDIGTRLEQHLFANVSSNDN